MWSLVIDQFFLINFGGRFPEYWEERRKREKEARILEAKAHWEFQCRAFVGIN